MPPITTAGTAPTSAAAAPDSKAPSSFDALMKTISTALTRPRSMSGVASAVIVARMFMLIMSAKPLTARATIESANECESPKTIMLAPKTATTINSFRPARRPSGRRVSMMPGGKRADRRRAAQDAEPDRPHLEDVAGEERQQRDGAAEQHRDEVERDRAEQHRRPADEPQSGEQGDETGSRPSASAPARRSAA